MNLNRLCIQLELLHQTISMLPIFNMIITLRLISDNVSNIATDQEYPN